MRVELPSADWPAVAASITPTLDPEIADRIEKRNGYFKGTFSKSALTSKPIAAADALAWALAPTMSRHAGRRLFPSANFAWQYSDGAAVKAHLDYNVADWTASIIVEQDAPWALEVLENRSWVEYPHIAPGECFLTHGSFMPHRRAEYTGKNCIVLICIYIEDEALAAYQRAKVALYPPYDDGMTDSILDAINFDRSALWDRKFPDDPQVLEIPASTENFSRARELAWRRLYHSTDTPDDDALIENFVSSDVNPVQVRATKMLEDVVGATLLNGLATGYAFRQPGEVVRRAKDPRVDWRFLVPLDEAAASIPLGILHLRTNRYTEHLVPVGSGVLVGGPHWQFSIRSRAEGMWAAMTAQEMPS